MSNTDFVKIENLEVRLDAKIIREAGFDTVSNAVSGKVVTFTKNFADIRDIQVSVKKGGDAVFGLYDFVDTPNPTSMTIFLYDETLTLVTGDFSWSVSGI